jgi:hypothetical protein
VLPWLVRLARCAGTRDFYPALAALVSPVQNIFFLTIHYFNICILIAQQLGQAVVQGRLSLNVCQVRAVNHTDSRNLNLTHIHYSAIFPHNLARAQVEDLLIFCYIKLLGEKNITYLHRLAESISWNQFLSSLKVYKFGLRFICQLEYY